MSRDILLSKIDRDPEQPRQHFDAGALQELADSLAATGQAVAITVRPVGDRYVIVQGERRYRAAQLLGWPTIRAEVQDIDAGTARWYTLVENIQRADLTPIEEAQAYQKLIAAGATQTEIAKRIGKTQSYIAQKIRLLKLPTEVTTAIDAGQISEGHARQLLRLKQDNKHDGGPLHDWPAIVKQCIEDKWSVRLTRHFVDRQVLVWYPQWSEDGFKFCDLMEFEKRLAADVRDGFASSRMHLEVQTFIGMNLVLHEQAVQAGTFPPQSIDEWPLERLCDLGDFWGMCLELDISWADTRDAWVALRLTECLAHRGTLSIQDLMSLSPEDFVLLVQEGAQVGRVWFQPVLLHLRWVGERYAQGKTVSLERFFHHPFDFDADYQAETVQHELQEA